MAPDAPDAVDREIRRAIEAEALAAPLPEDLGQRTLARALRADAPTARRPRLRPQPRRTRLLAYSGAAITALVAFLAIGVVATGPPSPRPGTSTLLAPSGPEQTREVPQPSPGGRRPEPAGPGAPADQRASPPSGLASPSGPKVARQATLEVQIEKGQFEQRWSQAQDVAAKYGGFVTSSSAQEVEDRLARGTLSLQVPVDRHRAALDELRGLGTPKELMSSATDVSGQFFDYESRLRVAQASEAQLLELLKQARSVEDNLAIRPRLEDVRREIETLQAQRASLQEQVDLATISTQLYERQAAPSSPDGRLAQAWRQAQEGASSVLAGMVLTAGYLAPLVLLAAVVWVTAGAVRRRRLL